MADEKILEEEVLDEAALENVAGGTLKETYADRDHLEKLGLYKFDGKSFAGSVNDGFAALSKKIGLPITIKGDISLNNKTANVYQIGNQKFTQEQFWNNVNKLLPKN